MTILGDLLHDAIASGKAIIPLPSELLEVVSNPITLIVLDEGGPTPVTLTYQFEVKRTAEGIIFAINPERAELQARTLLLWTIAGLEGTARPTKGGRWKMLGRTYRNRTLARRAARARLRIPEDIDVQEELRRLNAREKPASAELARVTAALIRPGVVNGR